MSSIFQQTFCNSAWYECHIYYNGDYGVCCAEWHKPDNSDKGSHVKSKYNIQSMTLREWYNSDLMRKIRKSFVTTNSRLSMCQKCYLTEDTTQHSRRPMQLQKSAIFPHADFEESYKQSPHYKSFEMARQDGYTDTLPIDFHIDLGNFCNCACKMCYAPASSTIAKQEVIWGNENARNFLGTDWTKDSLVWYRFIEELVTLPIKNLHFMGGETLLTPRFEQLVDYLIEHKRFDVNFSFVTNGTVYNEKLMQKLQQFNRIGIEISAETTDVRNEYVRQGTKNIELFKNIERYKKLVDNKRITINMRPVPSVLTIGTYHTLLQYCIDNNFLIQSIQIREPYYMDVKHLPDYLKQQYLLEYDKLVEKNHIDLSPQHNDYNHRDMKEQPKVIAWHVQQAINLLKQPRDDDSDKHLAELFAHCKKWDSVYGFDLYKIYPEFVNVV